MAELLHYVLWSIFFVTAIAILLRRRSSRNLALPPGPRPLPLLGNLLELGQNPHRSFALLARTHGPVMYLKLGSLHTVVISSPASAKEVFITKDHSTCGRQVPDVIQDVGHHLVSVVWLPPNQSWRYLRTLMKANLFNAQSLDATQLLRRQKDLFVAGSDTSTTTLEWAMVELLRRPELMARARDEIATVIGLEREVEESDISRLPFLQAVLKETLRFHPPAPLLVPHKTEERTEINGYTVPKNSQVLVNVWAIGRDEQVWENPDCFMPERFAGGCEIDFRGHHFELLPFGSGRRICPGMPLGVRMVQLMLASLLQSFEWSLPDGMKPEDLDLTEKFGLSTALAAPLKAIATPTKHN
nr:geraniol 8-hydroxylase-like protein [Phalaenopsis hybrid cultivar]